MVARAGRMWRIARIKKMVVGLTLAAWSNLRSAPAATSYAAWRSWVGGSPSPPFAGSFPEHWACSCCPVVPEGSMGSSARGVSVLGSVMET